MSKHSYDISLKWKEGRQGVISSSVLPTEIEVATPPEFDHGVPGIWSPEHLFTAAVVSCYMTTFLAIAGFSKLEFEDFDIESEGILDKVEKRFLMTEINLKAKLKLKDIKDQSKAERVLAKANEACLISNSINSKVNLEIEIS